MKVMSKKLSTMAGGACLALLSASGLAQGDFFTHNGPPEDGRGLEDYSYISLDGKVTIDPLAIYDDQITANPEYAEGMPDPSVTTMSLRFDYEATSGDELPFEIVLPVDSPAVHSEDFPKGRYSNMRMSFRWDEAIAPPSRVTWYSYSKVIVPNVHKIPVYMHVGALNKPFLEVIGDSSHRYLDFIRLRDLLHYHLERNVGRLATNVSNEYPNNHGCSGWYQFRFFGYLDGLERGIDRPGMLSELPPGITLVPSITHCSGDVPDGVEGCATFNGTRIALAASIFADELKNEAIIALHEIGHTKGLDHEDMPNDNVMAEKTSKNTVEIRKDQCFNFSVRKQYVSPDPWE